MGDPSTSNFDNIHHHISKVFEQENTYMMLIVVTELVNAGNDLVPDLLEVLNNSRNEGLQLKAAQILSNLEDHRTIDSFIKLLSSDKPEFKRVAAGALQRLEEPQSLKFLLVALEDEDEEVCILSAHALGRLRAVEAIVPITNRLANEKNWKIRKGLIDALRDFIPRQTESVLPIVKRSLKDSNAEVRYTASELLYILDVIKREEELKRKGIPFEVTFDPVILEENLDQEDYFQRLLKIMLEDKSSYLRARAADILTQFEDRRAIPYMVEALKDESLEVRKRVTLSLSSFKPESATDALIKLLEDKTEFEEIRQAAASALGNTGGEAATVALLEMFKNQKLVFEEIELLVAIINALGELKAKEALEPLVNLLSDTRFELAFLEELIDALVKYDDMVIPLLVKVIESSQDRASIYYAAFTLQQIGSLKALKAMRNLKESEEISAQAKQLIDNAINTEILASRDELQDAF